MKIDKIKKDAGNVELGVKDFNSALGESTINNSKNEYSNANKFSILNDDIELTDVNDAYSYTGPVFNNFGDFIGEVFDLYTESTSFEKAKNNLNFAAKMKLGLPKYFKISLDNKYIKMLPVTSNEYKQYVDYINSLPHESICDKCGMELNPINQCPRCDLGEEDLD